MCQAYVRPNRKEHVQSELGSSTRIKDRVMFTRLGRAAKRSGVDRGKGSAYRLMISRVRSLRRVEIRAAFKLRMTLCRAALLEPWKLHQIAV